MGDFDQADALTSAQACHSAVEVTGWSLLDAIGIPRAGGFPANAMSAVRGNAVQSTDRH